MNGIDLKFGHLIPENRKKFVNDSIKICCECGGEETTIATKGIYCRNCRILAFFKKSEIKKIPTEYVQFDDDD